MQPLSRFLDRLRKTAASIGGSRVVYAGRVSRRRTSTDHAPDAEGVRLFSSAHYQAINRARMEHRLSLKLPLNGKHVLDVGCGIGDLTEVFLGQGCSVVCVDGRQENINEVKRRFPKVLTCVADIDREDIAHLGMFDIVFCYGLLYHLQNPLGGLYRLAEVCREMLLLETMICDHVRPTAVFIDEPATSTQAMRGVGCRPSPSLVALGLNRAGFDHVYLVKTRPNHPHFRYRWKNNLESKRDAQHLRAVFVAGRQPMANPALLPLVLDPAS